MLGFTFNTTPAGNTAPGTENNWFTAPATGDVSVTLTTWHAQRPGIPAAGEGTYVDIGNSIITVDIPNAPCSTGTSGGCSGNGPENCGTPRGLIHYVGLDSPPLDPGIA